MRATSVSCDATPNLARARVVSQEIDVQAKDEFLLLACDGLWDVLDSQDAIDIISESFKNGSSAQVRSDVV